MGSILDSRIDGFFSDDPFVMTGNFNDFLGGEASPSAGCTGELSGSIDSFAISGSVDGRALAQSDFTVRAGTVSNLTFGVAVDPHPVPAYAQHVNMNADAQNGALLEIDLDGISVSSAMQCVARCHSDWSCDCAVYDKVNSECWKKRGCVSANFYVLTGFDVYVRPGGSLPP